MFLRKRGEKRVPGQILPWEKKTSPAATKININDTAQLSLRAQNHFVSGVWQNENVL